MKDSLFSWIQTLPEVQVYPLIHDLLRAMGFQRVTITHGSMEYGRDLVFLELDKLGREIWRGVQVKVGSLSGSLTSDNGIRAVVGQCEAALDTSFRLPSGEEHYLSEIWLLCTGQISEQAKGSIAGKLAPRFPVFIIDGPYLGDLVERFLPGLLASKSKPIDDYLARILSFSDSVEEYLRIRLTTKFSLAEVYVEPQASIKLISRKTAQQLVALHSRIGLSFLLNNADLLSVMSRAAQLPAVLHFKAAESLARTKAALQAFSTMPWYEQKSRENLNLLNTLCKRLGISQFAEEVYDLLPTAYRYSSKVNETQIRRIEEGLAGLIDDAKVQELINDSDRGRSFVLVDSRGRLTERGQLEVVKYRSLRSLLEFKFLTGQEDYTRQSRVRQSRDQFFAGLESCYRSSINEKDEMTQIAIEAASMLFALNNQYDKEDSRSQRIMRIIGEEFTNFHREFLCRIDGLWCEIESTGESLPHSAISAWPALVELEQLSRFAREFYGVPSEELEEFSINALSLVERASRLIILGELGMGKTTLLKQVARKAANMVEHEGSSPIPIFCRLTTVVPDPGQPLTHLFIRYSEGGLPLSEGISRDRLFWLLDGFDEIQSVALRNQCLEWLQGEALNERLVISARPFALPYYLPGALSATLVAFSPSDIERLVRSFPWRNTSEPLELLDVLSEVPELHRLASTPLLLTLIIILAQAQGASRLPKTRDGLYRLLLDLFLGEWDVAKGIRKTQTISDEQMRLKILRRAAFDLYAARKRSFSREEFVETIIRVRGPYDMQFDSALHFFSDLVRDCLLVPLSSESFGFFHFSIHEYLAATDLCDDTTLGRVFDAFKAFFKYNGWWEEVLVFYASMKRDVSGVLEKLHDISIPTRIGDKLNPEFIRLLDRLLSAADFTDYKKISPRGVVALALAELEAGGERDRWLKFARVGGL